MGRPWALLLLLAACGRFDFDPRADANVASSTRLKQVWNVFEDGPRLPETIYDTLLDVRCDPTPTTAGTACLPVDVTFPYYTDAACTQGVAQPTSDTQRYAYDANLRPIAHAYTVGAATATPAAIYQLEYDGSCAMQGMVPSGTWYALTDTPPSTYASLSIEYGSEGRLVSQQLVADDGFHTPGQLHDSMANGDCVGERFDDATVCGLYSADIALNYTDNGCTHVVDHAIVPVLFGVQVAAGPICHTTDMQTRPVIGELPNTTPIWLDIPGSNVCAATAVAPGRRLLDLGAPITLAPVTRQPVGGTRIQAIEDVAGAASADEPYLYDSQIGVECQPLQAADGVTRCLPSRPAYANPYFSDAGCTQPLELAAYGQPACATLPPLIIVDPVSWRVYRPGAKYTMAFYTGTPASCTMVTPSSDEYVLGAEIPPSSFASVTEQTDP